MMFCCPVCGKALCRADGALRCESSHCFDLAAGGVGYAYLLKPNQRHSASPGDSPDMVSARTRFLDSGAYAPFRAALCELAVSLLADTPAAPSVLDVCCGEGYYTAGLAAAVFAAHPSASVGGLDLAKLAVKKAAKRAAMCGTARPPVQLAVASAAAMPIPDASIDLAAVVFAPIFASELARVLRPGGHVIIAAPGKRHLYGLKEILYDEPYENAPCEDVPEGFTMCRREQVNAPFFSDDSRLIADLFAMTPYYWKSSPEAAARLASSASLRTQLEFVFTVAQKL